MLQRMCWVRSFRVSQKKTKKQTMNTAIRRQSQSVALKRMSEKTLNNIKPHSTIRSKLKDIPFRFITHNRAPNRLGKKPSSLPFCRNTSILDTTHKQAATNNSMLQKKKKPTEGWRQKWIGFWSRGKAGKQNDGATERYRLPSYRRTVSEEFSILDSDDHDGMLRALISSF